MVHYLAIVEEEPGKAVGIWFPDLPGCFSAGDTTEEAMLNAREAVSVWADALIEGGRSMPIPRSLAELKQDPVTAADINAFMVALIPYDVPLRSAAE